MNRDEANNYLGQETGETYSDALGFARAQKNGDHEGAIALWDQMDDNDRFALVCGLAAVVEVSVALHAEAVDKTPDALFDNLGWLLAR